MDRNFNGKYSAGIYIPRFVLCLELISDENSCPTWGGFKTDHRQNMCRISRIDCIQRCKFYHSVRCFTLSQRSCLQILFGVWIEHAMAQLVEALRCKPEGGGFSLVPSGVTGSVHWLNPSGHSVALGSTQPLRESNTRNISWGGGGVKAAGA